MAITNIQNKRALSSVWRSKNPILLSGELGIETDTKLLKVGDGVHSWNELDYVMEGLIESLVIRIQDLEEQAIELYMAIENAGETAEDDDIEEMLDAVFSGSTGLPEDEADDSTP